MDLSQWLAATTVLANVATFLGIPLGIIVLVVDRRRSREHRELETYEVLQSEYLSYLNLALQNPALKLDAARQEITEPLTDEEERTRLVAFEVLICMLESAYFHFEHGHRSVFKKRQWTGWQAYMRDWASRRDFQMAWKNSLSEQFDSEFVRLMNGFIEETAGTRY